MDNNILKAIDEKLALMTRLQAIENEKLALMTRLQAIEAVKGRPLQEQVALLHSAGMSPSEIAAALGKTANNIRVQLHLGKKSKHKENIQNE
jgi:DNA-directed RNA polymerase specialized sigma24 family protein